MWRRESRASIPRKTKADRAPVDDGRSLENGSEAYIATKIYTAKAMADRFPEVFNWQLYR
jgi:hypothetical protein